MGFEGACTQTTWFLDISHEWRWRELQGSVRKLKLGLPWQSGSPKALPVAWSLPKVAGLRAEITTDG